MKIKSLLLALPVTAFAAGCPAENASAFIQGVLIADPGEDCVVSPSNAQEFIATGRLDLGNGALDTANQFVAPLQVVSNLPSTFKTQNVTEDNEDSPSFQDYGNVDANIIQMQNAEVFFTTDQDQEQPALAGDAGLPVSDANPRPTTVTGTVFNENTQLLTESVVFATLITREDAVLLFNEPEVNAVLNEPTGVGRFAVIANVVLKGTTTGGANITTPLFSFPIELCNGCLAGAAVCPAGQVNVACNPGQDAPVCETP